MIAFASALLLASWLPQSEDLAASRLPAIERELIDLQRSRDALLQGRIVDLTVLRAGTPGRLELLRGLDVRAFTRLGIGPAQLEARLMSGLDEELRSLSEDRFAGSTLLRRLLQLEEELHARALVRLRQWGLPEPFGLAATSSALDRPGSGAADLAQAAGDPREPATAGPGLDRPGTSGSTPPPAAVRSLDPSARALLAVAAYNRGTWSEALEHYQALDGALDESTLEQHYRRADCLMKLRQPREAADAFRLLAERFPETPLGQRAAWNAKVAESLALLDAAGGQGE